jgi:hypothetical protein
LGLYISFDDLYCRIDILYVIAQSDDREGKWEELINAYEDFITK